MTPANRDDRPKSQPSQLQGIERRGLVAQVSQREDLAPWLQSGSRTLYCGFDPTASSMHIGHLLPVLMLRRFQLLGHRPIILIGGATGLIGDPSFKSAERQLNSREVVEAWKRGLTGQLSSFLDFDCGSTSAILEDNLAWTESLDVIEFLRDIGKHFSVTAMLQKESVRGRIDRDAGGISFTEFSYMILQSLDYLELAKRHDCGLQIGGTDQWGNITLGVDLVRRVLAKQVFALTTPLLTRSDGRKFGKTEAGAVWLDPSLTSPYSFYQYWTNVADADVVGYLKAFTFLDLPQVEELVREVETHPERRLAQGCLAEEVTRLVHGEEGFCAASRITDALFRQSIDQLTESDCEQLCLDGMAFAETASDSLALADALVLTGLAKSKGDARRQVASGGVSVNGSSHKGDALMGLTPSSALFGRYHLLRRGKKSWAMVRHTRTTGRPAQ